MKNLPSTHSSHYYAVIFTSKRTPVDEGYNAMATRMVELAQQQPGFIGIESARDEIGITVSYWKSVEAIQAWKNNAEHLVAQQLGKEKWYEWFTTRIAKIEREYYF